MLYVSRARDYILEIGGRTVEPPSDEAVETSVDRSLRARPWLSVYWKCCRIYSRIYRNRAATAYVGRCPRCARTVRARIGPDGTDVRLFTAE